MDLNLLKSAAASCNLKVALLFGSLFAKCELSNWMDSFDFVCCNWSAFQLQLNLWNPQLIHVELAFVRIVMWAACQRWSWSWSWSWLYLSSSVLLGVMHIVQPHTKSDITVPSQRMPSFVILFLFLFVNLEVVQKRNIWHQEFSETMRLFWISYHFMTRNWDSWETRWL
jgi:hypothetical protein